MRRIFMLAIVVVIAPLLMGVGPVQPNPRACGGTTRAAADYPCCVSGTVTLKGAPVEGATVTVQTEKGLKTSDVTGFAHGDRYPTFGILLNGGALQAGPGDVVTLTASYEDYRHTVKLVVEYGQQWLDLELHAEPDERLTAPHSD